MVVVHKEEDLPAVAARWAGLLPARAAHPVVPPADDPASSVAAAGMADWPGFHELLIQELQVHGAELVGASDQTNMTMGSADEANAANITAISPSG